jgi:RNA polymerase sigma-70 factor (ECF subfamily)
VTRWADEDVVAAVLSGDTEAFTILVRRYKDAYFRFAVRMLGNREDADDALQLAFVRAFRALSKCKDPRRFGAWLYQILMNECRTLGVRRARREQRMASDEIDIDRLAEPASQPESRVVDLEEIERALDQLDANQREAFLLKYVEELSYEEMSSLTGVRVSALKMRVSRACERLRDLLADQKVTS